MQTSSILKLSDYQRAILNEMGISCWAKLSEEKSVNGFNHKTAEPSVTEKTPTRPFVSEPVSKGSALARLAALKQVEQVAQIVSPAKTTDKVLLSISDELPNFIEDVLLAIGLEAIQKVAVPVEQVDDYVGAPLVWKQDSQITLKDNVLSTPAPLALSNVSSKKQLWFQLQKFVNQHK